MTSSQKQYDVELHRSVERFFRNHRELASNWDEIRRRMSLSPRQGERITHMKENGIATIVGVKESIA